jgi:hypothetical protein
MNDAGNAIAIEAWNTVLFDKLCRFRYVLTEGAIEPASPSHRQFEYQTCCER